MIAMFSHLCEEPFSIEEVHVTLPNGKHHTYPVVQERPHAADLPYINSILGYVPLSPFAVHRKCADMVALRLELSAEQALGYLKRMGLRGTAEVTTRRGGPHRFVSHATTCAGLQADNGHPHYALRCHASMRHC